MKRLHSLRCRGLHQKKKKTAFDGYVVYNILYLFQIQCRLRYLRWDGNLSLLGNWIGFSLQT